MEKVRITHPTHPLQGQQLTVIKPLNRKTETRFVLLLPDGSHRTVPISWTDQAPVPERPPVSEPPSLLALEGLYQATLLIERWQQNKREKASAAQD